MGLCFYISIFFLISDIYWKITISDIFGVDSQSLKESQDKYRDFADATSYIVEQEKKEGKNEEAKSDLDFMANLMEMISRMIQDTINLDIVISNLDKIDSINYSADKVTVNFNK